MLVLVFAIGCSGSSGGAVADYVLSLSPVTASNQAPFDGLDKLDLVLDPEVGDSRRVSLEGFASGETPEVTDLPALDGTSIVVEGYLGGELVAWGRTEPLTADEGDVAADVFVAENEAAAWLSALPGGLYRPVLAAIGDGEFLVAGGLTNDRSDVVGTGQDTVYKLSLAPPNDALGFEVIGTLPQYVDGSAGEQTNRFGATFTPLTQPGTDEGKVLLAGGSIKHPYEDSRNISPAVSIFDLDTETWEDLPDNAALNVSRAMHLAAENVQGNVVVWGGYAYQSDTRVFGPANSVEVYDRAARKFLDPVTVDDVGAFDAAMADAGTNGTMICGGTDWDMLVQSNILVAVDGCVTVSPDGSSVSASARMPAPLAGHAMVTLSDGRVLLAGGATLDGEEFGADYGDARRDAWIFDTQSGWTSVGQLAMPRAGHRMALLPDGRVLVAGGSTVFNPQLFPTDALSCLEVFDPASTRFTSIGDCDENDDAGGLPGRAYEPEVVVDPERGALIVGGVDQNTKAQNGVSVFVSAVE
jgi:hypothetical protein